MTRPQFSLKTLLWLMVVVAAFLGGARWQRDRDQRALQVFLTTPLKTLSFD